MLNRAQLIGHLGADPEVRRTQAGAAVVNLRLATSEHWRDKTTGERKEATQWHRVVIFSEALCKIAEQYLKKGSKVFIEGAISYRKYTDKDNVERWSTEIVLSGFNSRILMLDRAERAPAADESEYGVRPSQPSGQHSAAAAGRRGDLDDEIPF